MATFNNPKRKLIQNISENQRYQKKSDNRGELTPSRVQNKSLKPFKKEAQTVTASKILEKSEDMHLGMATPTGASSRRKLMPKLNSITVKKLSSLN